MDRPDELSHLLLELIQGKARPLLAAGRTLEDQGLQKNAEETTDDEKQRGPERGVPAHALLGPGRIGVPEDDFEEEKPLPASPAECRCPTGGCQEQCRIANLR